MTPNAQHIALMTALGWTQCRIHTPKQTYEEWCEDKPVPKPRLIGVGPEEPRWERLLPDLSLDLMHTAEKTLTIGQLGMVVGSRGYRQILVEICVRDADKASTLSIADAWHATKEQRLEAFLRAKDLWRDDQ